jgi:hypothetical protein
MPINGEEKPSIETLLAALERSSSQIHAKILARLNKEPRMQLHVALYTPVAKAIKNESDLIFTRTKSRFLNHAATYNADRLRQAGIDDAGILCMEMGILPHNADGEPYAINIDHIIDRSGFNADPALIPELSNAYSNLVCIDFETHGLKTNLVHEQTRHLLDRLSRQDKQHAEPLSKWIVTLVPYGYPKHEPVSISAPAEMTTIDAVAFRSKARNLTRRAYNILGTAISNGEDDAAHFETLERTKALSQKLMDRAAELEGKPAKAKKTPTGPTQPKKRRKKKAPSVWGKPRGMF